MKRIALLLILNIFAFGTVANAQEDLAAKLSKMSGVSEITKLESTYYQEKYSLLFEQPIDHLDPSKGTFKQRVVVCNVSMENPTVMVTEGYGAAYAFRAAYRDEVASLVNGNIVVVEHRYFLESTPENRDWTHFNAEQAANDHHRVFTALKKIYPAKWIATGISKGGQTAMIYRAFFPNDVDITIPYVAPLCRGIEDGRHEPFISNYAGTPEDRKRIEDFQIEVLKRKPTILPKIDSLIAQIGYKYYNLPPNEVYDYCVLEFPFAFWQMGTPMSSLPALDASDEDIFNAFIRGSGPDYFVNENTTSPFFVQAAKELGYYGYDTKPFEKYLDIKSADGYLHKIFFTEGMKFEFNDYLYKKVSKFIATTDAKMIFIYGQFDPWSAVMPDDPGKDNIRFFIQPGGSHRARISTLPPEMRAEAIWQLMNWLKE